MFLQSAHCVLRRQNVVSFLTKGIDERVCIKVMLHAMIINATLLREKPIPADLRNMTGSSIYCWETEANGGHIEVTT